MQQRGVLQLCSLSGRAPARARDDVEGAAAGSVWLCRDAQSLYSSITVCEDFEPRDFGSSNQKRPFVHNAVCSQFLDGLFQFWLSVRISV